MLFQAAANYKYSDFFDMPEGSSDGDCGGNDKEKRGLDEGSISSIEEDKDDEDDDNNTRYLCFFTSNYGFWLSVISAHIIWSCGLPQGLSAIVCRLLSIAVGSNISRKA